MMLTSVLSLNAGSSDKSDLLQQNKITAFSKLLIFPSYL